MIYSGKMKLELFKPSLPLNLGTNGFTFLPKRVSGQNELIKVPGFEPWPSEWQVSYTAAATKLVYIGFKLLLTLPIPLVSL